MTGFGIKRFLAKTFGLTLAIPKPLFDGPPENPEYFMLWSKPGARYADRGPSVYQLVDEEEGQRLRKLRFERYLEQFPEKRGQISEKDDVLRFHNAEVDPDHVPKSCVFRKKVSFASNTFTDLSVIYGLDCPFVRPPFKDAVESVAPGLIQFFPYDCQLKTGEVFAQGYLMHWSQSGRDPVDKARSGLGPNSDSQRLSDHIQNGQMVIRRSLIDGVAMQFFGLAHQAIYAKPLAERLAGALGKNEQLYPVHVLDDV